MKVSELITELQKLDQDAQVILQKDSEGNGYSPCYGVEAGVYIPESTWSGLVYDLEWTSEEAMLDPKEWEKLKQSAEHNCAVLWPVN